MILKKKKRFLVQVGYLRDDPGEQGERMGGKTEKAGMSRRLRSMNRLLLADERLYETRL